MKKILEFIAKVIKMLFPKSRWGNVIYLIIGLILANYEVFEGFMKLVKDIINLF